LSEEKCLCLFLQTMATFPLNKRGESFYRIKKKLIKKFDQKKYVLNSSSDPTSYFLIPTSLPAGASSWSRGEGRLIESIGRRSNKYHLCSSILTGSNFTDLSRAGGDLMSRHRAVLWFNWWITKVRQSFSHTLPTYRYLYSARTVRSCLNSFPASAWPDRSDFHPILAV